MKKLLSTVAAILAIALLLTGCPGSPKDEENTGGNSGSGSGAGGSGSGNETPAVTQKTIKNAPDAIGDIVLKDGKAIAYYDGLTLTDAEKADAIAVIFYAGGDNELGSRKLGVGLYEYAGSTPFYAKDTNSNGRNKNTANNEINGLLNQTTIERDDEYESSIDHDDISLMYYDYDVSNFPAFHWAGDYHDLPNIKIQGSGVQSAYCDDWYVPATKELKKLLEQSTIVNKAFAKISDTANKFPETGYKSYWSSTTDNTPTNSISPEHYENAYYFTLEPQASIKVQGPISIKKDSALAVRAVHTF